MHTLTLDYEACSHTPGHKAVGSTASAHLTGLKNCRYTLTTICQQSNVICVLSTELHQLVARIAANARAHSFDLHCTGHPKCRSISTKTSTANSASCHRIKHGTMENQLEYLHRIFLLTKMHHWKTDCNSDCFGSLA